MLEMTIFMSYLSFVSPFCNTEIYLRWITSGKWNQNWKKKMVSAFKTTSDLPEGTWDARLYQNNKSCRTNVISQSQEKGRPGSAKYTLVTIDTGSGINITHHKSLLLDYKAFNSPLTTYFGVRSEENQIPIKLIGQKSFF